MAEYNVGALLVYDDDHLLGVISERDYARKIVLQNRTSRETKVSDIMSKPPIVIEETETVRRCLERMTINRIRHMPVLREGQVVGVVSMGDLVDAIMKEQDILIQKLEKHIREHNKVL
jgi:CBS domain-containing protein